MDIWTTALISSLFMLAAIVLTLSQVRSWRAFQSEECAADELAFRRRRFRRRMECSILLGLLGAAMFAGELVNARFESQWLKLIYWGGVLLVAVWMGLLGAVDILGARHYYGRLQDSNLIEQTRLRAELRRLRSKEGNGEDA